MPESHSVKIYSVRCCNNCSHNNMQLIFFVNYPVQYSRIPLSQTETRFPKLAWALLYWWFQTRGSVKLPLCRKTRRVFVGKPDSSFSETIFVFVVKCEKNFHFDFVKGDLFNSRDLLKLSAQRKNIVNLLWTVILWLPPVAACDIYYHQRVGTWEIIV